MVEDYVLQSILFNPKLNGGKDHWIADCPQCGRLGHLFINRITHLFDCKICNEEGNEYKLLLLLDKLDLFEFKQVVNDKIDLSFLEQKNEEDIDLVEDLKVDDIKYPIGYKRISTDSYLLNRGFILSDFQKYDIGRTSLLSKFDRFVLFSIKENRKLKGYVGRNDRDKNEIKRLGLLRYNNSKNTDFAKLLFGIDELSSKTKTAILVEGIFDKNSTDHALELNNDKSIKCLATFGHKISLVQFLKLKLRGIENVILIFDIDSISEMKKYSQLAKLYFKTVQVGFTENKDLNESNNLEIINVFDNLYQPNTFDRKFIALNLRK